MTSPSPRILPYVPRTVAEAIAGILDHAAAARGPRGRCSLAIPGGRSPGPVLSELARCLDGFVRERLDLFWVDERFVADGHADRNDVPTLAAWRAGGALPDAVHPMPADRGQGLDAAAADYEAVLQRHAPDGIDVALIGLGEDGHIASLFPRHPALRDLGRVTTVSDSPKPPPQRLTLTLGEVTRIGTPVVLVLGRAKGALVRRALRDEPDHELPVGLLPRDRTLWWFDDEALTAPVAPTV